MKNTTDEYSARITFTLDRGLKDEFDTTIKEAHYNTRSAALTEAMRDLMDKIKKRSRSKRR